MKHIGSYYKHALMSIVGAFGALEMSAAEPSQITPPY